MVIDPSYESIRLSEKIYDMGNKIGKPVFFIINKADKDQAVLIKEALKHKSAVITEIPADPDIMMAGLKGEPLNIDLISLQTIMDKLAVFVLNIED